MALSVRAGSPVRDRGPAQRALEGAQGHRACSGARVPGGGAGLWVLVPLQVAASCTWQNYGNHCRNGPQETTSGYLQWEGSVPHPGALLTCGSWAGCLASVSSSLKAGLGFHYQFFGVPTADFTLEPHDIT